MFIVLCVSECVCEYSHFCIHFLVFFFDFIYVLTTGVIDHDEFYVFRIDAEFAIGPLWYITMHQCADHRRRQVKINLLVLD